MSTKVLQLKSAGVRLWHFVNSLKMAWTQQRSLILGMSSSGAPESFARSFSTAPLKGNQPSLYFPLYRTTSMAHRRASPDRNVFSFSKWNRVESHSLDNCVIITNIFLLWLNFKKPDQTLIIWIVRWLKVYRAKSKQLFLITLKLWHIWMQTLGGKFTLGLLDFASW